MCFIEKLHDARFLVIVIKKWVCMQKLGVRRKEWLQTRISTAVVT